MHVYPPSLIATASQSCMPDLLRVAKPTSFIILHVSGSTVAISRDSFRGWGAQRFPLAKISKVHIENSTKVLKHV